MQVFQVDKYIEYRVELHPHHWKLARVIGQASENRYYVFVGLEVEDLCQHSLVVFYVTSSRRRYTYTSTAQTRPALASEKDDTNCMNRV